MSSLLPLIAVVVVAAVFAIISPNAFLTAANVRTIADQAALPLILAMGATFVILMGGIDLSIEGIMATSSLTFVLLSANSSTSINLGLGAAAIALLSGALIGLVTGIVHTRLRAPSFMVSLGVWYIGLGIATVLYGNQVPQLTDAAQKSWVSATPFGVSNGFAVALVVVLLSAALSRWTKFGRFALAIGADEELARLNSVPVARYKTYIFMFAGVCSALAGIIGSSQLGVGTVSIGRGDLFFTIAAVVVGGTLLSGGRGGVFRSFCGVLLLTVINNGLVIVGTSPDIQQTISGLVIVATVVVTGLRYRARLRVVK
jgi:ribose transport system permease protein